MSESLDPDSTGPTPRRVGSQKGRNLRPRRYGSEISLGELTPDAIEKAISYTIGALVTISEDDPIDWSTFEVGIVDGLWGSHAVRISALSVESHDQ